jgi:PTH1 family peptidyl-tRNA hydrolase
MREYAIMLHTMTPEFKPETIKLIVGLGNPGTRYAHTYHNAGRIAVRALSDAPETGFATGHRFLVPNTFMNESGSAVKRALRVKPKALLVVHDDADLPLGSYRLSFARGAAGHHGVESVIRALGTKEFWRLRIGVRPLSAEGPEGSRARRAKADTFVLRPMTKTAEAAILMAVEEFERTRFSLRTSA